MLARIIVLVLLLAAPAGAQVVSTGTSDPGGYSTGFTRSMWASSLGCVLLAYGNGSSPGGNNSLRCYRPVQNDWITLYANTSGATGPNNRDNQLGFYVDNLKQFWVYGGTFPAGVYVRSGRFNLSACVPIPTTNCATLAYSSVNDNIDTIENFGGGGSDSGQDWNPACDGGVGCGIIVGGNGVETKVWIIERNTAAQITALGGISTQKYCGNGSGGSFLWIMCEYTGSKPTGRNQALGSVVAVDGDFYVGAGSTDSTHHMTDLWKFTRATNAFSSVTASYPAGASGSYQTNLTYDSDLGVIFFYLGEASTSRWIGWDIATASWIDATTPMGLPCRFDQVGTYMPTVKKHFFSGGNICGSGNGVGSGVTLVSPSGLYLNSKLYLAPGLWTFRSFAGLPGGVMGKDTQSVKHMSMAVNLINDEVYNIGGDWGVTTGNPISDPSPTGIGETARNEVWSFNPLTNTATLQFPYCGGTKGDVTVARPTEVGVVWDGTQFWILPGYEGQGNPTSFGDYRTGLPPPDANPYEWPCNLTTQALPVNAILKFNVTTKKFSQPSMPASPCCGTLQLPKNGRYDSVNNSIWRIGTTGVGTLIEQYFITSNTWQSYQLVCAADPHTLGTPGGCGTGNAYINDVGLGFEQFAMDDSKGGRKIYILDTTHYRLIIINMASCVNGGGCGASIGARPPAVGPFASCLSFDFATGMNTCPGGRTMSDYSSLQWDNFNNVVLYPFIPTAAPAEGCNPNYSPPDCGDYDGLAGYPKLVVYDPVLDVWSQDASLTDTGARVRGNSFIFHPNQNFLVSYGGCIPNGCNDGSPGMTGYWVYRKGGTSVVSSVATLTINSTPATDIPITVSPNDNSGAGDGLTNFTRTYTVANKTAVTAIAPATASGNPFSDWTGCDSVGGTGNRTCTIVITNNKTITAHYTTIAVNRTLTINSTPSGIPMIVSPNDINGNGNGTTPFTRTYADNAPLTITAPLTSGTSTYTIWGPSNCTSLNGPICNLTMSSDKIITVPYVACLPAQNSVQFSNVQNQCNWSYRDSSGALMTYTNGQWTGPEGSLGIGSGGLMHPGTSRSAVRRWTAPVTMDITITGNVRDADTGGGDGINASIVRNSTQTLFTASIDNGNIVGSDYSLSLTVMAGDTIDFIVAPRANNNFDTTVFDPLISLVAGKPVRFGAGARVGSGVRW